MVNQRALVLGQLARIKKDFLTELNQIFNHNAEFSTASKLAFNFKQGFYRQLQPDLKQVMLAELEEVYQLALNAFSNEQQQALSRSARLDVLNWLEYELSTTADKLKLAGVSSRRLAEKFSARLADYRQAGLIYANEAKMFTHRFNLLLLEAELGPVLKEKGDLANYIAALPPELKLEVSLLAGGFFLKTNSEQKLAAQISFSDLEQKLSQLCPQLLNGSWHTKDLEFQFSQQLLDFENRHQPVFPGYWRLKQQFSELQRVHKMLQEWQSLSLASRQVLLNSKQKGSAKFLVPKGKDSPARNFLRWQAVMQRFNQLDSRLSYWVEDFEQRKKLAVMSDAFGWYRQAFSPRAIDWADFDLTAKELTKRQAQTKARLNSDGFSLPVASWFSSALEPWAEWKEHNINCEDFLTTKQALAKLPPADLTEQDSTKKNLAPPGAAQQDWGGKNLTQAVAVQKNLLQKKNLAPTNERPAKPAAYLVLDEAELTSLSKFSAQASFEQRWLVYQQLTRLDYPWLIASLLAWRSPWLSLALYFNQLGAKTAALAIIKGWSNLSPSQFDYSQLIDQIAIRLGKIPWLTAGQSRYLNFGIAAYYGHLASGYPSFKAPASALVDFATAEVLALVAKLKLMLDNTP